MLCAQTSDLVKRRYSTRFANLPSNFDPTAPPVPSVPSLPLKYAAPNGQGRGVSPGGGRGLTVDLNALRDPGLRPEQCQLKLLCNIIRSLTLGRRYEHS